MNLGIDIATASHIGKKRPHNEDSVLVDNELQVVVLADGMGGYKAGEVASAIAVTTIHQVFADEGKMKLKKTIDAQTGELMRKAINQANLNIYKMAHTNPHCSGMGTTVLSVLVTRNKIIVGNVGDSRMYRFRSDDMVQVTKDHTLIQELVDRGLYSAEEANAKMPKNLVTRALGLDRQVMVDVLEEVMQPEDIYLLCTDGLNDMVNDEEIHLTLSKYSANLAQAANKLVDLANHYGGKDNISVALLRINPVVSSAPRSGLFRKNSN